MSVIQEISVNGTVYDIFAKNVGVDIFDFKPADHIINDINWLRADTFGFHDGTVYQNMYNHLVDDYTNATQRTMYFETAWTQPIATAQTTTTDLGDVVITASSQYSGRQGYKCMDGVKSGTATGSGWNVNNTSNVATLTIQFPYKLRITGIKGYKPYNTNLNNANTVGQFYADTDKTITIGNEYSNADGAPNWTEVDVTGIPAEGIITDTLVFEKTGGGNYGGFGELEITATRILRDGTLTLYEATDGHIIVPYSQNSIDGLNYLYSSTGIAWMYVLDTTNQQFILPRTKFGFVGYRDKVGSTVGIALAGNEVNATQMYLYFYAGGHSRSAIEETAGLNASLFDGKADISAQNFTSAGKKEISNMAMPSDTFLDATVGASGSEYEAPESGRFYVRGDSGGSGNYLQVVNGGKANHILYSTGSGQTLSLVVTVSKGDVIALYFSSNFTLNRVRFVYTNGSA